jgi:N-acyltransferase N-terminal domain
MTAQSIRDLLGLGEDAFPWLDELQALGPPPDPVELPSPVELPALLARLGVPADQIPEIVEARPSPERDPALWWVFARCHHLLLQDMGGFGQRRAWPAMPARFGASGRYVYVWVFLATLPVVRRYHASRGIPDDVAWATLADLGRHVAIHRQIHGEGGLSAQNC